MTTNKSIKTHTLDVKDDCTRSGELALKVYPLQKYIHLYKKMKLTQKFTYLQILYYTGKNSVMFYMYWITEVFLWFKNLKEYMVAKKITTSK